MDEYFRPYGLVATAGGSGGGAGSGAVDDWEPVPGAAVGVSMLSGDASITGIGTITGVEGDRILAFGHPMFQAGSVNLPLVSAEIHTLIPSRYVSFKLGSPVAEVGALRQDRRPGIAGSLGAAAPKVPIDIVVDAPGAGRSEYHYEAMNDRRLTPVLTAWALRNSVLFREKAVGDGTIRIKLSADLEGAPDLEMENLYSSGAALQEAADNILLPLQVLANNSIARPELKSVRIEVTADNEKRSARIEEIILEKGRVRPGGTVRGRILLRRFQGDVESHPFEIPLPPDMTEGKLLLRVCDAASSEEWDTKRSPLRFATKEIDRLVSLLEELRTNDGVYIQLFSPAEGATVDGREMPRLPASVLEVIGAPLHDDDASLVKGRVVGKQTIRIDAAVGGCKSLPVIVERGAP